MIKDRRKEKSTHIHTQSYLDALKYRSYSIEFLGLCGRGFVLDVVIVYLKKKKSNILNERFLFLVFFLLLLLFLLSRSHSFSFLTIILFFFGNETNCRSSLAKRFFAFLLMIYSYTHTHTHIYKCVCGIYLFKTKNQRYRFLIRRYFSLREEKKKTKRHFFLFISLIK